MESKQHIRIGFDTIIMSILALISLETNVPFVLDQLDFHRAMPEMGFWKHLLCPGGAENPLALMGSQFVPFKLLLRTITLGIVIFWFIVDIKGKHINLKIASALSLIILHILIPDIMMIQARSATANHALAHDGGTIQMEEAMKMVLKGKNPYSETFHGTPLENWRGFSNNVVFHVPYMPGAFMYSLPAYVLLSTFWDHYDQRVIHLLMFVFSLYFIAAVSASWEKCLTTWMIFALNPFSAKYLALGTNDIVILFWLLLAVVLIQKQKVRSGLAALAAACAVKQFAWFFVPFLAAYGLQLQKVGLRGFLNSIIKKYRLWAPAAALAVITIVPFLLWDIRSFIDDTFRYGSGGLPTSYPMQGFHGYGFATLLLFSRLFTDGRANFPFIVIQAITVVPLFIWLWRKFIADPDMPEALTFSALCLLVFMFFSRYLHGNFVGFIIFWPALSWGMLGEKGSFP
ncbi:MAG: glycosyltransferase 87 family protein [bacterium]